MARLNTQVTALYEIGPDAMDNLYDVIIIPPEHLTDTSSGIETQMRLRAAGFSPPQFDQQTYSIQYKTVSMNRPSTHITGERSFTITFRLDAYYQVYQALLQWRSLVFEPSVGYANQALPDDERLYGVVSVYTATQPPALDDSNLFYHSGTTHSHFGPDTIHTQGRERIGQSPAMKGWEFYSVWISQVQEPQFQNANGDAQSIEVTFQFGDYLAPSSSTRFR